MKKIEDFLQEKLDIIVGEIKRNVKGLRSIILIGGYARGEGAIDLSQGQPDLYNDFDIYIVTDRYIQDSFLEKLAEQCSKLIGKGGLAHPEAFEQRYKADKFFHVDIRCLIKKEIKNLLPTIRYYEMKHTAKLLWGENSLAQFPDFKVSEIPKAEGIRLIMNRMMLLLMSFNIKFISDPAYATKDEKKIILYYVAKSYLTIAEALLLFNGFYPPTYRGRAKKFAEIFPSAYPEIAQKYPDLAERVLKYTQFKFRPNEENLDNYLEEWFKCREVIGVIYKKCLSKLINQDLSNEDWFSLSAVLKKKLTHPYFKDYARALLKRYHLKWKLLNLVVARLGQTFLSYKYFLALRKALKKTYWPVLSLKDPGLAILRILPLILYTNDKDNQINQETLSLAKKELKKVYPEFAGSDWLTVKTNWLYAYRIYYLQRFV